MNTAVRATPNRWGVAMVSSPYVERQPPKNSGRRTPEQHRTRRVLSARYCRKARMTPPERVVLCNRVDSDRNRTTEARRGRQDRNAHRERATANAARDGDDFCRRAVRATLRAARRHMIPSAGCVAPVAGAVVAATPKAIRMAMRAAPAVPAKAKRQPIGKRRPRRKEARAGTLEKGRRLFAFSASRASPRS